MFFHASEVRKYMIHPLKSIKIPFPGVFLPRRGLLLRWSSWISRISIAAVRCTWPPSLGRPKPCLGGIRFFGGKGLEIHGMGWVFHHIPYESIWNMMTYVFFESSNHLKIHEFYGNFTIFSRFFRWFHDQPRDGPGKSPILWGNLLRFLMARFYQRVFSDSPKNSANSCGWPTLFSGEDGMNWMIILCLNLVLILTWFSFVVATPSGHLGHLGHGTWFLVATVQPRKIQKPWFSHV